MTRVARSRAGRVRLEPSTRSTPHSAVTEPSTGTAPATGGTAIASKIATAIPPAGGVRIRIAETTRLAEKPTADEADEGAQRGVGVGGGTEQRGGLGHHLRQHAAHLVDR